MSLPNRYKWLEKEQNIPLLTEMLKIYGIIEFAGEKNNPVIMGWAKELGRYLGAPYASDATAWCGLGMGIVALRAGYTPPDICIRAKSWANFGKVKKTPELGDVLIFTRDGGGHVGLYVAESQDYFHVLGCNQGDACTILLLPKNRLWAVREPNWKGVRPANVRRVVMDNTGKISHNEA